MSDIRNELKDDPASALCTDTLSEVMGEFALSDADIDATPPAVQGVLCAQRQAHDELLAALKDARVTLAQVCEGQHPDNVCWHHLRAADTAIAKAEGK
jgi:hypothetical protein